jgi:hypothetical protein
LHRHTAERKKSVINGAEAVLLSPARRYGYASLAEAEKACR